MQYLMNVEDEQAGEIVQEANLLGVDEQSNKRYTKTMRVHHLFWTYLETFATLV